MIVYRVYKWVWKLKVS